MDHTEQYRTFWQVASDGVLSVATDLTIIATNPSADRILGHPSRSLKGRLLSGFFPEGRMLDALRRRDTPSSGTVQSGNRPYRWKVCPSPSSDSSSLLVLSEEQAGPMAAELADAEKWEETLTTILDSAYEGIVVVDENGIITLFNQAYCDFLGVKADEMIGRQVQEVVENTRMHVVVKTGKAEYRQIQRINGHDMVCDRIPIREGGKIIGAVGKVLFRDLAEVDELLVQTRRLQQEVEYYKGELRHQLQARYSLESIIGQSRSIEGVREMIRTVARSISTVLLRGESGTGKELVAHAIHNASPRQRGPFVKVNCAAIPESLLESELFGYEEGAFTGAARGGRIGKFERAEGGTIFLDEVGDMPLSMQVKLLRVLQEREFERVGGNRPIQVNVRMIAASNQSLEKLVAENRFRIDLFYRLNVIAVDIPPLRERKEDLPLLIDHLLSKLGKALGCGRKEVSLAVLEILVQHQWPGNVRELENVLERALNVADGPEIQPRHLPYYLIENRPEQPEGPSGPLTLRDTLARAERELLQQALTSVRGNHAEAARLLGLSRSALYEKMARYGIR